MLFIKWNSEFNAYITVPYTNIIESAGAHYVQGGFRHASPGTVAKKYVGCIAIELLFQPYRAICSTDRIFCFVSAWSWHFAYGQEHSKD